jgi:hypothetical protein
MSWNKGQFLLKEKHVYYYISSKEIVKEMIKFQAATVFRAENFFADIRQLQILGRLLNEFNTLKTGSFKFFKRPSPGFLTILTL